MGNYGKWIWGGLGWAMFGPLGGLLGYAVGSMAQNKEDYGRQGYARTQQTGAGDFGFVLLVLFAAVMKADGKVLKSELDYVKSFFRKHFGGDAAREQIRLLQEILKQNYSLAEICGQIRANMNSSERLQIIHVLFEISQADGNVHPSEVEIIHQIAGYLGISTADYESIQAMFYKDTISAYKVLEIEPSVTNDEVKKAYRNMAKKFHPDKVSHLGAEFQKFAEEKFKALKDAYDSIKKERNMR
ncbi:TerB family tellurite resistance protein [bacterium]|nr:TerB family tellurite resistance protein [bacterium]